MCTTAPSLLLLACATATAPVDTGTADRWQDAAVRWEGDTRNGYVGKGLVLPGDLDGDGLGELVALTDNSDPWGSLVVLSTPASGGGALTDGGAVLALDPEIADGALASLADQDGNGQAELILGQVTNGAQSRVLVVEGPLVSGADVEDLVVGTIDTYAGGVEPHVVSGVGDLDGDGVPDLGIGYPDHRVAGERRGGVWLFSGPVLGEVRLDQAAAVLLGEAGDGQAGATLTAAGDVDGDGYGDLLVAAPEHESGSNGDGVVYLLHGPVGAGSSLATADARIEGERSTLGTALAGDDLDGDGHADLVVSVCCPSSTPDDAVYLFWGPLTGTTGGWKADVRIVTTGKEDELGQTLALAGDVNRDGHPDLWLGAPGDEAGADWAGGALLALGPFDMWSWHAGDRDSVTLHGEVEQGWLGTALAGGSDLDGDGAPDVVLGAPGENGGGEENAGAVYVLPAGSLTW